MNSADPAVLEQIVVKLFTMKTMPVLLTDRNGTILWLDDLVQQAVEAGEDTVRACLPPIVSRSMKCDSIASEQPCRRARFSRHIDIEISVKLLMNGYVVVWGLVNEHFN